MSSSCCHQQYVIGSSSEDISLECSNENKVSEAQLPEEPKIIIKEVPKEVIRYVNSGEGTDIENVRSIEFLRKNWETIYDQKIASIYNNYSPYLLNGRGLNCIEKHQVMCPLLQVSMCSFLVLRVNSPKYSKMYVNNTNGIYWGYVYNTCWNMKSKELELYQNPDNEQDLPEKIPPKGNLSKSPFIFSRIHPIMEDEESGVPHA